MAKVPDRLYIDEKDRELYDRIESTGMFKGRTRKEQFLFALGLGFNNGLRRPLGKREGFFLTKDMRSEDEALLNAVAAYDAESLQVLSKKSEVFKIAEEYAHAGIRLLVDKIEATQHGSFEKRLEKELQEMYKEIAPERDDEESPPS